MYVDPHTERTWRGGEEGGERGGGEGEGEGEEEGGERGGRGGGGGGRGGGGEGGRERKMVTHGPKRSSTSDYRRTPPIRAAWIPSKITSTFVDPKRS